MVKDTAVRDSYGWGDLIVKDQLQRYAPRLPGSTPGSPTVRQLRCCRAKSQTGPAGERQEKRVGARRWRMWQLLDADRVCTAGYTAFREASALAPVPLRLRGQAQFGRERRSFLFIRQGAPRRRRTHTRYCTHTHAHTQGRQATWLHPTIWIFCPIWWWRVACLFPETECELSFSFSRVNVCFFLVCVIFTVLKSSCPMWKCCSAAGYVTWIGVTMNARAGVSISLCDCVSYALLLLISVYKLHGERPGLLSAIDRMVMNERHYGELTPPPWTNLVFMKLFICFMSSNCWSRVDSFRASVPHLAPWHREGEVALICDCRPS